MGARLAEDSEKYLGIIVTQQGRENEYTQGLLLERMRAKLAGWRVGLLSAAGRLALIKAVLVSIPIYYMSVGELAQSTIGELNKLVRLFFWGQTGEERHMSLIAWDKICQTYDKGGLGIRNLKLFNQSLLLKAVWQVASNSDKIWVQVVRAKYFSRRGFWGVSGTRDVSRLWRSIQKLKPFFREQILWHVGDGQTIPCINQPWFPNWHIQVITTNVQRDAKVADLYNTDTHEWNREAIRVLIGPDAEEDIITTARKPTQNPVIPDRLIWKGSKTGSYNTKEGYKLLSEEVGNNITYTQLQQQAWQNIWKWKDIQPRVKVFLWKAVHRGLPTLQELHRRVEAINQDCPRCGQQPETLTHIIFQCPIARATWFASHMALRSEGITCEFTEALLQITHGRDGQQIAGICNMIWCLWKGRNESIFTAKPPTPWDILRQVGQLQTPQQGEWSTDSGMEKETEKLFIPASTKVMMIDGSWEQNKKAGWGALLYDEGGQFHWGAYEHTMATDPLHAEAIALRGILQRCQEGGSFGECQRMLVLTDSRVLAKAVREGDIVNLPSWGAAETVATCVKLIGSMNGTVTVQNVGRHLLKGPHKLGNYARVTGRTEQSTIACQGSIEAWLRSIETIWRQEWYQLDWDIFQLDTGTQGQQTE